MRLDRDERGDDNTNLLRDGNISSCIDIFPFGYSNFLGKVLNPWINRQAGVIVVKVIGQGVTCSPIGGVSVKLYPVCEVDGPCRPEVPCTALQGIYHGSWVVCKSRCQLQRYWDYLLVDISPTLETNESYKTWKMCEITID